MAADLLFCPCCQTNDTETIRRFESTTGEWREAVRCNNCGISGPLASWQVRATVPLSQRRVPPLAAPATTTGEDRMTYCPACLCGFPNDKSVPGHPCVNGRYYEPATPPAAPAAATIDEACVRIVNDRKGKESSWEAHYEKHVSDWNRECRIDALGMGADEAEARANLAAALAAAASAGMVE